MIESDLNTFTSHWQSSLRQYLPLYTDQIEHFVINNDIGLQHAYMVYKTAKKLQAEIEMQDKRSLNSSIIEYLCIFHDIGKFFQNIHTGVHISLARSVWDVYATNACLPLEVQEAVRDGIQTVDFYNVRLHPTGHPPRTLEADIVRAADNMQDNLVQKVDRCWYKYGLSRGAVFFDPALSNEERADFSLDNYSGDQLNVMLSLLALRPEDFTHPITQENYRRWSLQAKEPRKEMVKVTNHAKNIKQEQQNDEKAQNTCAFNFGEEIVY